MVIEENGNSLELTCLEVLPRHSPGAGDLRLAVRVTSHGFSGGRSGVWVAATAFASFLTDLRALDSRRKGAAEFEAMSLEKFQLCLRAVDRLGHMVVEGRFTQRVEGVTPTPLRQAIEFAFEFCPSRLPRIVVDFESLATSPAEVPTPRWGGQIT